MDVSFPPSKKDFSWGKIQPNKKISQREFKLTVEYQPHIYGGTLYTGTINSSNNFTRNFLGMTVKILLFTWIPPTWGKFPVLPVQLISWEILQVMFVSKKASFFEFALGLIVTPLI